MTINHQIVQIRRELSEIELAVDAKYPYKTDYNEITTFIIKIEKIIDLIKNNILEE